jgi:hypothetical protein
MIDHFAWKRSRKVVVEKTFRLSQQKVLKLPPTTMGNVALEKPAHPFSSVDSLAGLAQMLGVPKEALFCVKMMEDSSFFFPLFSLFYCVVLFFRALVVVGVTFLKPLAPCPKRATNTTARL